MRSDWHCWKRTSATKWSRNSGNRAKKQATKDYQGILDVKCKKLYRNLYNEHTRIGKRAEHCNNSKLFYSLLFGFSVHNKNLPQKSIREKIYLRIAEKSKNPNTACSGGHVFISSLIRTLPSVQESHLFGSFEFADFTAGMESHHSPKAQKRYNIFASGLQAAPMLH